MNAAQTEGIHLPTPSQIMSFNVDARQLCITYPLFLRRRIGSPVGRLTLTSWLARGFERLER